MKVMLISFALIFSMAAAQADLVMKLNLESSKIKLVVKIKDDKIRYDTFIDENEVWSIIADLKTGDRFRLDHMTKKIVKNPSILHDYTNATAKVEGLKFEDSGKSEMLNKYEAEIYTWTDSRGRTEKLWIAKNYPNFKEMRNDLSKIDIGKSQNIKIGIPQLSSLSGMPLKLIISDKGDVRGLTFTLLSAKEESIDNTNFDLPRDYHFSGPTNAPIASTNEVTFATNGPAIK